MGDPLCVIVLTRPPLPHTSVALPAATSAPLYSWPSMSGHRLLVSLVFFSLLFIWCHVSSLAAHVCFCQGSSWPALYNLPLCNKPGVWRQLSSLLELVKSEENEQVGSEWAAGTYITRICYVVFGCRPWEARFLDLLRIPVSGEAQHPLLTRQFDSDQ